MRTRIVSVFQRVNLECLGSSLTQKHIGQSGMEGVRCVAMFCCNVVAGFERLQANVSKLLTCGKPPRLLALFTPVKVSEQRLKLSAGIRNPMLYPTELQAPGLFITG